MLKQNIRKYLYLCISVYITLFQKKIDPCNNNISNINLV